MMTNSNQQQNKQKESPSFTGAYDPNAAKTRQQLDNYDLRATGHNAGSEARLSVKDMQGLADAGYQKADIIDYASGLKRVSDVRDSSKENFIGDAAYNLLDTWKSDLMNKGKMDWDGRNKPKEVDDDYSNYINKNIDLKFFVDGAQKQGELQSPKDSNGNLKMGENSYTNAFNKDVSGWEKNWVEGMNKMHGTSYSDMGQFNRSQIGQYHYETFGKNENRKFAPQNHTSPTPAPTPTPDPGSGNPTPTPAPTPSPTPTPGQPGNPASDAKDRAQKFLNKSEINGDNNYVYQNQDNSVRNYGGDNRTFTYNGSGSNGGMGVGDTPATMATLSGFYAPDDSHAAQAARFDRNVTMNRDAQKKYANTSHIAQGAIKRAEQNSYIDPKALDQRIAARTQYHKDQATIKGAGIFGDIYGMEGPTWNSSKPAKEVEQPDFKKMYDTYTNF